MGSKQTTICANDEPLKLIIRILKRIIDEPSNSKFQKLDFQRLCDKLGNDSDLLQIFYIAGFHKSDNGKRLLFDLNSLDKLEAIYDELTSC